MSFSMAEGQLQGLVIENKIYIKYHLYVILTGKSIYGIMFVMQGDIQGEKVNLKVTFLKKN